MIFLNSDAPPGSGWSSIMIFGILILFMYFFMFRPQQKRMKEAKNFRNSLEKGQNVVTAGGIHGKISSIQETTVVISTDSGKLTVEKSAISSSFVVRQ